MKLKVAVRPGACFFCSSGRQTRLIQDIFCFRDDVALGEDIVWHAGSAWRFEQVLVVLKKGGKGGFSSRWSKAAPLADKGKRPIAALMYL